MSNALTNYVAPAGISAIPDAEELREAWKLAQELVKTGFLPRGIDTPAKAVAVYLKGRELGLPFMQAMGSIHIVEGRPGVSAELMRALCQQRIRGFNLKVLEHTDKVCRMEFRRDGYEPFVYEYTMADATRAGLDVKNTYKANPKPMLSARCTSQGLRIYCADALMGVASLDELEDAKPEAVAPEAVKASIDRALGGAAPAPAPAAEQSGAVVVEGAADGATTDSSAPTPPAVDVAAPSAEPDYDAETANILESIYGAGTFTKRGGPAKLSAARKELVTWATRRGLAPAVVDEKAIYGFAVAYKAFKAGEVGTDAPAAGTDPAPAREVTGEADAGASETVPGATPEAEAEPVTKFDPAVFLARCNEGNKVFGGKRTFAMQHDGAWWFVDKTILGVLGCSEALPINDDAEVHPLLESALRMVVAASAEHQRNHKPAARGPAPL